MFTLNRVRSIKSDGIVKKPSWLKKFSVASVNRNSLYDSGNDVSFLCGDHVFSESIPFHSLVKYGFCKNAIVYRAISLISKSVASVNFDIFEDEKLSESPEIIKFINNPNSDQDKTGFLEAAISYLLLSGNSYIYVSENPLQMQLLRPDRVEIVPNKNNTQIDYYLYKVNGSQIKISDTSKVIHLKFFNPNDDWYGLSPLQAAAQSIDQHNAISSHNIALMKRGGRPTGCLIHTSEDGCLTDEQIRHLRENMEKSVSGTENAGRILVLDGEFRWQDFGNYTRDYDFHKGKEISAREIAQTFGVPPMLVGISGDSTFANYKEARLHLWEDTVIPLVEYLTGKINHWISLNLRKNISIKPNLDGISALAKKREKLWKRISNCDFLTINEKRKYLGFSELNEYEITQLKKENA